MALGAVEGERLLPLREGDAAGSLGSGVAVGQRGATVGMVGPDW